LPGFEPECSAWKAPESLADFMEAELRKIRFAEALALMEKRANAKPFQT
jgi:hypothetical protein